jgi:hypothetical protein
MLKLRKEGIEFDGLAEFKCEGEGTSPFKLPYDITFTLSLGVSDSVLIFQRPYVTFVEDFYSIDGDEIEKRLQSKNAQKSNKLYSRGGRDHKGRVFLFDTKEGNLVKMKVLNWTREGLKHVLSFDWVVYESGK